MMTLIASCGLRAAEAVARPDVAGYSYDLYTVMENVAAEENEFARPDAGCRKVGQPTPGILLSVLMAGGMARLLLRQRRRAMRRLIAFVSHVNLFTFCEESHKIIHSLIPFEPECCLRWQRTELRL